MGSLNSLQRHYEIKEYLVRVGAAPSDPALGCARFPEILPHFSERQIFWRMCSVVFLL